jgi:hypothetical protein
MSPPEADAATAAAAAEDYFAACRARVPAFARRHFGLLGTLRLHKEAVGLDLLRSPFNVLLVGPALFLRLFAMLVGRLGLKRLSRWLATRRLFVETRISRRIAELVSGELLGLDRLEEGGRERPAWTGKVEELVSEYVAARHAVAEMAAGVLALVIGLVTLHAVTPSAISLGPMIAREYAQANAVESFWAGRWAGSWYYSYWPAEASALEVVGATVLLMMAFAVATTFMGLITDPIQQALGLHERRLARFVDTLERLATRDPEAKLTLPDPYIARLADVADWVTLGLRYLR